MQTISLHEKKAAFLDTQRVMNMAPHSSEYFLE